MRNCRQPLREAVSWNEPVHSLLAFLPVSLFVRLWVEMNLSCCWQTSLIVSLFVRLWVEIRVVQNHRKVIEVSLFVRLWVEMCFLGFSQKYTSRQPLREAVSWNARTEIVNQCFVVSLFVRLWVEIYFMLPPPHKFRVSLFVRLWVEIYFMLPPPHKFLVSLFVRLWVEIWMLIAQASFTGSASSWGCELK